VTPARQLWNMSSVDISAEGDSETGMEDGIEVIVDGGKKKGKQNVEGDNLRYRRRKNAVYQGL
jgi:hypothetical protein